MNCSIIFPGTEVRWLASSSPHPPSEVLFGQQEAEGGPHCSLQLPEEERGMGRC